MNKSKYFVLLAVLLVASCSGLLPEPTEALTLLSPVTSTPLPTSTHQPTAIEIRPGKLECQDKGHITTWDLSETWLNTYTGSINEKPASIGITLVYSGNSIEGVFFYTDKPNELKINGCLEKDRNFTLYAYHENDERLAVIQGEFPEVDPLGGYNGGKLERSVIIGTWENELTGDNYSIYLRLDHAVGGTLEHQYKVAGATDDKIIDKAAQDFLNAVASNDKEFVTEMIEYPIWVTISGTQKEIKNQDEFLAYYEKIFTDEFKTKLALMRPKHMFAKWSGIMLGHGEIWFNAYGKIIAINNGGS